MPDPKKPARKPRRRACRSDSPMACPHCGEEGDCRHALLAVELSDSAILGGALARQAWSCLGDLHDLREAWGEGGLDLRDLPEPFERVLHAMDAVPCTQRELWVDDQPGCTGSSRVYHTDAPGLVHHLEDLFHTAFWEGLL